MKIRFLLFAIAATIITSCNTAYKSGQTPDDVYYSPLRVIEEDSKKEEEKEVASNNAEDREIKMKIKDRRWRDLNDDYNCNCSCDYTPYKYGYNYGYYYNPYYYAYPVYLPDTRYVNPKISVRTANLGGYTSMINSPVVNPKTGKTENISRERTYNNSNNTKTREVFSPSVNNSRTYSPSSNSNRSGSDNKSSSGNSVPRSKRN